MKRAWQHGSTGLLVLASLVGCESPTVPERFARDVYDFRLQTPALKTLHWPLGTTVHLYVNGDGDATHTQWLHAAAAFSGTVWNSAALYEEVIVEETSDLGTADVVVQYSNSANVVESGNCVPGGGQAYTTFCLASGNLNLAVFPLTSGGTSRVKFLVTVRATAATDEANVRRLVAHEIGHVLGIAQHSPKSTDLMFGGLVLSRDDPSPADRATLQVLYHTKADITP